MSTKKVGGIRFFRIGPLRLSFCVSRKRSVWTPVIRQCGYRVNEAEYGV